MVGVCGCVGVCECVGEWEEGGRRYVYVLGRYVCSVCWLMGGYCVCVTVVLVQCSEF